MSIGKVLGSGVVIAAAVAAASFVGLRHAEAASGGCANSTEAVASGVQCTFAANGNSATAETEWATKSGVPYGQIYALLSRTSLYGERAEAHGYEVFIDHNSNSCYSNPLLSYGSTTQSDCFNSVDGISIYGTCPSGVTCTH